MREISFRAWDKVNREYIWPYPSAFHIIGEVTVFELLKQSCKSVSQYNDLLIEQYTGLKDQNGVKIFEGDILRQNGSEMNYEVVFQNSLWHGKGDLINTSTGKRAVYLYAFEFRNCQKTGNIHTKE